MGTQEKTGLEINSRGFGWKKGGGGDIFPRSEFAPMAQGLPQFSCYIDLHPQIAHRLLFFGSVFPGFKNQL